MTEIRESIRTVRSVPAPVEVKITKG